MDKAHIELVRLAAKESDVMRVRCVEGADQQDAMVEALVNRDELKDHSTYWFKAEERLIREITITKTLPTPVNFIVHTLQEVTDALAHGRFFFVDIARDGIALYQADDPLS